VQKRCKVFLSGYRGKNREEKEDEVEHVERRGVGSSSTCGVKNMKFFRRASSLPAPEGKNGEGGKRVEGPGPLRKWDSIGTRKERPHPTNASE